MGRKVSQLYSVRYRRVLCIKKYLVQLTDKNSIFTKNQTHYDIIYKYMAPLGAQLSLFKFVKRVVVIEFVDTS